MNHTLETVSSFRPAMMALCASAALFGLPAVAAPMSKPDYNAGKERISATYKADKAACKSLSANANDICEAEAEAKEELAKAELEANYSGKPADRAKVAEVRAEGVYDVAKERCDDKSGNAKDVCVEEAKAVMTKAKADAKLMKETGKAQADATQAKNEAGYKVEAEKCDALAGDAKASCVRGAKARFGMN